MRRTKEDAEITRQLLLKAALTVFSRQGYSDTRLEEIAAEAGVTRGAIYHHFGGKAELYTALVAEASARIAPIIRDALAESGSVLATLRGLFVQTLVFAEQDPDFRAINELVLFKTALPPELAVGIERKKEGTRQLISLLAAKIQVGIDGGEIRVDINAVDAAIAFLALQNGLLATWLFDPTLFALKNRATAMADLFIQGLVPVVN